MIRIAAMMLCAMSALGFQTQETPFAGKWSLDLQRSVNLPESFKGVESYIITARQTKDSLILLVDMRGAGQHVTFPISSYDFRGKETYRNDSLRGTKRWSRSSRSSDGTTLTITSRTEQIGMDKRKQKFKQTDVWKLINQKTLQLDIRQVYTLPKSETRTERRIFHRMN